MTFLWPILFFALILVPLLAAAYLLLQRSRARAAARFTALGLAQGAAGRPGRFRRHFPAVLFLAGLSILLVGLTRPQTEVSLPRVEGTIILAFDVSGSMAADDMQPTRMEAAKAAARGFVERQPKSVQIGVVGFSDGGYAVQAPTTDRDEILAAIQRLTPQRGTSLAHGILASMNTIDSAKDNTPRLYTNLKPLPTPSPTPVPQGVFTNAAIVLLTDGENNEPPDPLEAAQAAADRGVRIYTVGIGSPGGTTLHINGFSVHTQLNEEMLQQISQITHGMYSNAGSAEELRQIYDTLKPELVIKTEKTEVTAILAGVSLLVLLISGSFSLFWFNRLP
jgi:Ca-activated chloride channel family protein